MAAVSIPIAMGYAEVSAFRRLWAVWFGTSDSFICLLFDIATVYLWRGCRTGSNCWRQCELPWNCIWICGSDRLYFHDRLMHRIVVVTVYVLKTGKMVDFISTPVMGGFVSGIAVTIILMQIPKGTWCFLRNRELPELLHHLWKTMHHVNGMSVVLGCVSLLIIVISRKIAPKFPMVVVVMVAGVLLTKYASIEQYGVRMLADVKTVSRHFVCRIGRSKHDAGPSEEDLSWQWW